MIRTAGAIPARSIMATKSIAAPFRITQGKRFRLKDYDPAASSDLTSKDQAAEALQSGVARLSQLQDKLYADNRWAVLLIFQAMDAAGKDSVIKHVLSGINPLGCQVYAFKAPSPVELDHDFLWRTTLCLPERGRIGIFNRSYYEEVLAVRVNPDLLRAERLPPVRGDLWKQRFEDINAYERHLTRNGTVIRKFFLHVSRDEQRKRFLERLEQPEKYWKFSAADVAVRQQWDDYMAAYEQTIRHTSSPEAPWYVVPADKKWFTRLVVSEAINDALESLNLRYPKLDPAQRKQREAARALLAAEDD
ncbi:MAG: polyphosphate kinase 2 family protein [Acidobacteria bacterium]|nr:polyphosphate kinase 2 family protein [Acidobacteriota bacterium]